MKKIHGTQSITIPAIEAKTFDMYWLQSFQMLAKSPDDTVTASFVLIPQNSKTGEIAPQSRAVRVNVADVFATAELDPTVLAAIEAVLIATESIAKSDNLI